MLNWIPDGFRKAGRPLRRWDDDIVAVAGGDWAHACEDESLWQLLRYGYVIEKKSSRRFAVERVLGIRLAPGFQHIPCM